MAYATWGRSLAPQPPPGSVGDDAFPSAAQPPGSTPGILTMYPGCTPRPRDRRTYEAACAAADGQLVVERFACQIKTGMRAWCAGHFLDVVEARHMRLGDLPDFQMSGEATRQHKFVLLHLEGDGATTGWLIGEPDNPVYCLA